MDPVTPGSSSLRRLSCTNVLKYMPDDPRTGPHPALVSRGRGAEAAESNRVRVPDEPRAAGCGAGFCSMGQHDGLRVKKLANEIRTHIRSRFRRESLADGADQFGFSLRVHTSSWA